MEKALRAMGRPEQAAEHLWMRADQYPRHAATLCARARLQKVHGHLDQAMDLAGAAMRLAPDRTDPHGLLAWLAQEQGDAPAEIEALRRLIAVSPGRRWAHARLAWLYRSRGSDRDAEYHEHVFDRLRRTKDGRPMQAPPTPLPRRLGPTPWFPPPGDWQL